MRNASPILSIVVPVRNGKKFIFHALESLAAISEAIDIEVIFQDAMSTDGTSEVIERFCAGHPERRHFWEKDGGQSDAINRGVSRARGKWVTWLCADDVVLPELAPTLAAAEQAGADVFYGDVVFFQEAGVTPAIGTETCEKGALARRRLIIQQPGTCISRKAWRQVGGVKTHLNWSMDYDLFLRLESEKYRFYRSRHFVAVARIHRAAKTSSGSIKRLFEIWSVISRSHLRSPMFFRFRPYLVYGLEFVIKLLESKNTASAPRTRILGKLHQLFWLLVRPREANEIQNRFYADQPRLSTYLERMAGS